MQVLGEGSSCKKWRLMVHFSSSILSLFVEKRNFKASLGHLIHLIMIQKLLWYHSMVRVLLSAVFEAEQLRLLIVNSREPMSTSQCGTWTQEICWRIQTLFLTMWLMNSALISSQLLDRQKLNTINLESGRKIRQCK